MQSDVPQAAEQDVLNASAQEDSGPDEEGEEEMEQEYLEDNSDEDEDASQMGEQSKKVRDKLATISIPYEGENQPIVFSYHYKYEKYLRDNNLIDVSRNLEKKTLPNIFI